MAVIDEIGPGFYRISEYVPDFDLQFNHFLVNDDEPLLFHAGLKGMFPSIRDAVATVIDPSRIRWVGFSHFESDECGALNQWLEVAPAAEAVCSTVSALVSVNDFASRPTRGLADDEVFKTGKYSFRLCRTPHLPHDWDASVLFEETTKTLLCSDLFHQVGKVEPLTQSDVVGRSRATANKRFATWRSSSKRFLAASQLGLDSSPIARLAPAMPPRPPYFENGHSCWNWNAAANVKCEESRPSTLLVAARAAVKSQL